jgi:succinyl-CoA synthetase beta subunit
VAATTPEKILYLPVDPRYGLLPFEAMRMGFFLYKDVKLARRPRRSCSSSTRRSWNAGCSLAEINPLV